MDSNQFGQAVKNKYPQYAQVPNDVLTQKVIQKYPQYQSALQGGGQPPQAPAGSPQQPMGQQPFNPPRMDPQTMAKLYRVFPDMMKNQAEGQIKQQDPLYQAQTQLALARAQRELGMANGRGQGATSSVWRNTSTGEVSDVPQTGDEWKEYAVKPGQALQTVTNAPFQKQRADAQSARVEAINRRTDASQTDALMKATGLDQANVRNLQSNNQRADRALTILNDPSATWQAFNGWVSTDFAGMMQGGAPHKEGILSSQFPNWRAQLSQIRTYMSNQPEGKIPPGFRDYMKNFVNGIRQIDNDYLLKSARYKTSMLVPTIRGGAKFGKMALDYTNDFTKGGAGSSAPPSEDMSKMSDDELRKLASQ